MGMFEETQRRLVQVDRFTNIMRRHVWVGDAALSDDDLVRIVFQRYGAGREQPLIDPNE